jgi:hypothetical protein
MESKMKRIEDIEKMGLEELEAAAMEEKVEVPQGLAERIRERILAAELAKELPVRKPKVQRKRILQFSGIAAAAVVVFALVLLKPGMQKDTLQDTFEDPYLAYAQVEKAFAEISSKMSLGVGMVAQAKPLAEKPMEILNNVIDKK